MRSCSCVAWGPSRQLHVQNACNGSARTWDSDLPSPDICPPQQAMASSLPTAALVTSKGFIQSDCTGFQCAGGLIIRRKFQATK